MEKGYHGSTPPTRWEEAALCGNGTIGAVAMCDPLQETVILSHEKLFLPQNPKMPPVDTGSHLGEIRAMLASGDYAGASRFVVELSRAEGYHGAHWTDSFMPACDLSLKLEDAGAVTEYQRAVDFTTGVSSVSWNDRRGKVQREMFVSRADNALVMRVTAGTGSLSGSLDLLRHAPDDTLRWLQGRDRHLDQYGRMDRQARVDEDQSGPAGTLGLGCAFRDAVFGYACSVRILAPGGTLSVQNDQVVFTDAKELLLLATLSYAQDAATADPGALSDLLAALPQDFSALSSRHLAIHTAIFDRLDFHLGCQFSREGAPEVCDGGLTAGEIWQQSRSGTPCDAVYERLFHAGRYHVLASSGETPPNLQGIWTGTYTVPWSSDYTQNGNTQTAILTLLPGNMAEMLLSYFDYQESLLPDYRENARRLYGCRGIHLPSRTSNHGYNNHFNENWPHTFWTAGAGWAAHFYYDYWLYTGDREFFLKRALPFMKEAALFYEDFLTLDADGHWMFSPSYSPENHPAGSTDQACVNATMDIAVARELFGNLVEGCLTLHVEMEHIAGWQRMLDKMPPYRINRDGALQEWCHDGLEDRYDHRHASHLYPLYYGVAREIRESPELYEACAQAYRLRLQERRKEFGVMGFGLIQLGFAAAHLGDAATVETILRALASGYYYSNFASSHNAGPDIFNVDISGGLPALIMETIVQSRAVQGPDGAVASFEIRLLPCLPVAWCEGRLKGVRARGGFWLDIEWAAGTLVRVTIDNPLGNPYTLEWDGQARPWDGQVRPWEISDSLTLTAADFAT